MHPVRTALVAAFAAGLLCACGKAEDSAAQALAEQALEARTGQKVDIRSEDGQDTVTIDGEQGRYQHTTGENVPLPSDFPKDVVLPSDYSVVSVMTMGPARSVVLRSREPLPALFERYQSGLAGQGWKETVSMQGEEGSMLGFEKDKRGVLVNLRSDIEGHTVISLSLQAP
ncbi:hypothetical protein [Arenimonas sp. MALMAid1274]|uniref:hypothetical protein n=1 Tax=Arenimonas sp. MALMAid1274 TaxID=3411630 RepID=UPI003BA2F1F9